MGLADDRALPLWPAGRRPPGLRPGPRAVADEVGLDPGPALRELEGRILGQDPDLEVPGRTRSPVSLPTPGTPLVGRAAEVDGVLAAFAGGARIITLTGPGGVGKTRLALAVAQRVAKEATERLDTRFVAADSVTDGDQLVTAVAASLELSLPG